VVSVGSGVNFSQPGVFSQSQNGIGFAAARHAATEELVDQANPAQPGEYISIYMTGLGAVTPAIADGAVGPSNPLSTADCWTNGSISVVFNDYGPGASSESDVVGTIQFAGHAPGQAGLYQVNVQVPTTGSRWAIWWRSNSRSTMNGFSRWTLGRSTFRMDQELQYCADGGNNFAG
jgi:uncharacterized protein (TIGR03437 family)